LKEQQERLDTKYGEWETGLLSREEKLKQDIEDIKKIRTKSLSGLEKLKELGDLGRKALLLKKWCLDCIDVVVKHPAYKDDSIKLPYFPDQIGDEEIESWKKAVLSLEQKGRGR
jgi:hypothetical protein